MTDETARAISTHPEVLKRLAKFWRTLRNGVSGTMPARTLEQLKRHLRPGRVYRREDLLPWSHSVDRHLRQLTADGTLQKLRNGLYYLPRKFEFGEAPADEHELVRAFLKSDNFVVTSRMRTSNWNSGRLSFTTSGLSTTRSDTGHFLLAIGQSPSSVDITCLSSSLPSSCWSISLTS
jgi:hypothetical protein